MTSISALVIEDSFYSADLNIRELKKAGYTVHYQIVASEEAMKRALIESKWDLIISDNSMPNFNVLDALKIRNDTDRSIPFIIVSEYLSHHDIDKAFKAGCSAFISKENLAELRIIAPDIIKKE